MTKDKSKKSEIGIEKDQDSLGKQANNSIFLGLGSNLPSKYGDRFDNLNLAINFLNSYGIKIIKQSSFYETLSYPNIKNPKFINIVVSVNSDLPPMDLMSVLIFIEEKLERKRSVKNDPRTCDIDIIDYKGEVKNFRYKNFDLILPHKNLIFRNFVLFPLKEIDPQWKHPITKENTSILIENLSESDKKSIKKV